MVTATLGIVRVAPRGEELAGDIHGLIGQIYDAAVDHARWPDTLGEIGAVFGGAGVNLRVIDMLEDAIRLDISWGASSDGALVGNGALSGARHYRTEHTAGADWVGRSGGWRYYVGRRDADDGRFATIFTVQQTPQRPVSTDDKSRLAIVADHVGRSVEISRRLGTLDQVSQSYRDTLDRLSDGIIWLDRLGRVQRMNRVAGALVARADGLRVRHGELHASFAAETQALQRQIKAAIDGGAANAAAGAQRLALTRPSDLQRLAVLLAPLARRRLAFPADGPAVLVMVSNPDKEAGVTPSDLMRLFDLTRAEAKLAAAIVAGRSLQEHARQRVVAVSTARWHLKHVLAKTGAHSQAELVALVLRKFVGMR